MSAIRFLAMLALIVAAGCGSGDRRERVAVSGTVTHEGKPIEDGRIVFEPAAPKLPMAGAPISEGNYQIEKSNGPGPGPYTVRIEAYRKKIDPTVPKHPYLGDQQEVGVVTEQVLPDKFNTNSTLHADITREEATYDFKLE